MDISGNLLKPIAPARWDTSSSCDDPQTVPTALDGLDDHAQQCGTANGRWFDALVRVDAVRSFVALRPISVIVVVVAFATTLLSLW